MEETFDIFAGDVYHLELAVWMAKVAGFDCAKKRMMERAAAHPGDYFIYDARHGAMAAQIHTRPATTHQGNRKLKRRKES